MREGGVLVRVVLGHLGAEPRRSLERHRIVHGIELDTPRGMRRWWFAPQGDSLRLESANQRHDFAVTGTPTGN